MKSKKPFWELNLNPITMMPTEESQCRTESKEKILKRRVRESLSSADNFNKDVYGRNYKKDKRW